MISLSPGQTVLAHQHNPADGFNPTMSVSVCWAACFCHLCTEHEMRIVAEMDRQQPLERQQINWLAGWLTNGLMDWPTDWLTDELADRLTDRWLNQPTDWQTDCCVMGLCILQKGKISLPPHRWTTLYHGCARSSASWRSHMWVIPPGTLCPTASAPWLILSSSENCWNLTLLVKLLTLVDFCVFVRVLTFDWLL